MASSPAYAKHPDHRVSVEPNAGSRIRVEMAGRMIAESEDTLRVLESRCRPVVYLPQPSRLPATHVASYPSTPSLRVRRPG